MQSNTTNIYISSITRRAYWEDGESIKLTIKLRRNSLWESKYSHSSRWLSSRKLLWGWVVSENCINHLVSRLEKEVMAPSYCMKSPNFFFKMTPSSFYLEGAKPELPVWSEEKKLEFHFQKDVLACKYISKYSFQRLDHLISVFLPLPNIIF